MSSRTGGRDDLLVPSAACELLKLKRTLAFRVIFVLPFFIALLQFFVIWRTKKIPPDFNLWGTRDELVSNLGHLHDAAADRAGDSVAERHRTRGQAVEALVCPARSATLDLFREVHRRAGFDSREHVGTCRIDDRGWTRLNLFEAALAPSYAVPVWWITKLALEVWLAAWLIIAIHTWVSMRWAGFPIPLGVGIGGTFFALFAASAWIGKYYPWLLPMNLFLEGRFTTALILGIAGGLLGCFAFIRHDVA